MSRVQTEPAFVMHNRPYRETSALVDLLSLDHGLVSVVARGVRGKRRRGIAPIVPFTQLSVSYGGRSQLQTLTGAESVRSHWLTGAALYAGLYVNELTLRLIRHNDSHPALFVGYAKLVTELAAIGQGRPGQHGRHGQNELEPALRRFEKLLLRECGYELVFDRDAESAEPVEPAARYRYIPDKGFIRVTAGTHAGDGRDGPDGGDGLIVDGSALLAIEADDFREPHVRHAAKRIMRRALAPHIGDKGLRSRALFREREAS